MTYLLSFSQDWRAAGAFLGLLLFMGIENLWPFKSRVESRLRRYFINFFVAGSNALAVNVLLGAFIVSYIHALEQRGIGFLNYYKISPLPSLIVSILVLDAVTWFWHLCYHRVPWMWRLHQVHHSDRDLDATTASRFHLGEILLSTFYRMAVMVFLGPGVPAVALYEAALLLGAQFQHSNLKLPDALDWLVRWVIVTPDMHRVHHSELKFQTNSNYSVVFSWWDRIFGTYEEEQNQKEITIGLPEYPDPKALTLARILAMPTVACSAEQAR